MVHFSLRQGLEQPRPLPQLQALLADGQLQGSLPPPGPVGLIAGDWLIGVGELLALQSTLQDAGFRLKELLSSNPRTRVAAASIGLAWECSDSPAPAAAGTPTALRVHQGTLRSGDLLETDSSVLILGDVNPGARVVAGGHVLVWGTLRGVAHAGSGGDQAARIVALQLRPLQLRIAAAVARGPADGPVAGFAEQAELIDGAIAINPAAPQWPLT